VIAHAGTGGLIHADQSIGARLTGNYTQAATEQIKQVSVTCFVSATGEIAQQNVVPSARCSVKKE